MDAGFQHFANKDPNALAVVDPGERYWTRREIFELSNRIARGFQDAGLAPGDVIAIIAPNCAEYMAAYFAGLRVGLLVAPVNWHLALPEIEFILRDSETRAVFTHAQLGDELLQEIARQCAGTRLLICVGNAPGYISLEAFVAAFPADPPICAAYGQMLPYTSATTGRPKAVRLLMRERPQVDPHAQLERIVVANAALGILPEAGNVHLCASMLYHSAPLGGAEVALQMGHPLILAGQWSPELLLQLIEKYRVTTTFMVPAMFVRLLKLPTDIRERYSTASLRFVIHGAAPCPAEVKRRMIEWWGDVVWESYGATEAQGTIVSAKEWLEHPGTVGRPMKGSDIRIFDERGRELPPNEVGRVHILPTTGLRFEYRGDPDKTRQSYRGDYVCVGDLGYVDEEGYLFLCDRSSDLIISSGMNIYPAEIETLLVEHPAVADCAVIGEPHELLGQVPKVFVQLEPGFDGQPRLTLELLQFLGERLSAMKLPKRVQYVPRVPRDPNGKLLRRSLLPATGAPS